MNKEHSKKYIWLSNVWLLRWKDKKDTYVFTIIFMTYELLRMQHETGGERKEKAGVGVEKDVDGFIS